MHSGAQLLSILSQQWCTDYDFFTQINFNFILFYLYSHIFLEQNLLNLQTKILHTKHFMFNN